MKVHVPAGVATGVGSLPHTDAAAAADFVLRAPAGPAGHPVAAPALAGRADPGPRARRACAASPSTRRARWRVDVDRLDPLATVVLDLSTTRSAACRPSSPRPPAAVGRSSGRWSDRSPSAWRWSAGALPPRWPSTWPCGPCGSTSGRCASGWPRRCRRAGQVVVIDEPGFSGVMEPGFPIPPDTAIDLTSGALAAIEQHAMMGVHCCAEGDWAAIAATGPDDPLGPGRARADRGGRSPQRVPRDRRLDRMGRGADRSPGRHGVGPLLARPLGACGARWCSWAATRSACGPRRSSRPACGLGAPRRGARPRWCCA